MAVKPAHHQTMLEDKNAFVCRCREGCKFFKNLRQRGEDLSVAKSAAVAGA